MGEGHDSGNGSLSNLNDAGMPARRPVVDAALEGEEPNVTGDEPARGYVWMKAVRGHHRVFPFLPQKTRSVVLTRMLVLRPIGYCRVGEIT
jgi:hypothetical protein